MPKLEGMPCFFLGANTPKGYFSRFDQLLSAAPKGRCFLLKGGPGTGKSSVLKKTAAVLKEKFPGTELIFCSADADSLDAVITPEGDFAVMDATLPHSVEPKYPGVYETVVSLCDCWNEAVLKENGEKAAALFEENRKKHEEARRYIAAAASLFEEAAKTEGECIDKEKIIKAARRICYREFGKKNIRQGAEKVRFLSAVTNKGICFFEKTAKLLCPKIYVLEDNCGAVSRIFMAAVRKTAVEHGLDIITCPCSVFPSEKIEHVLIPQIGVGFITSNKRHRAEIKPYKTVFAKRFIDEKKYRSQKARVRLALRLGSKMIDEAAGCMNEAKQIHDELEKIYISAMDFSLVDKKAEEIINCIQKKV